MGCRVSNLVLLFVLASCDSALTPVSGDIDPNAPTYSMEISRLVQTHCQSCHRPGGHAPNPYMTYAEVRPYAEQMLAAVAGRIMPDGATVRVDTGCGDETTFDGPRQLTQDEIDTVAAWVRGGVPEGDPADLPEEKEYVEGEWQAGAPDLELANDDVGFTVPPQLGRDIFRRFAIQTNYETDKFISSFEALPGDGTTVSGIGGRQGVVHHVTMFIDEAGTALADQTAFAASNPEVPGPGYEGDVAQAPGRLVGMWFPGSLPLTVPDGIGIRLPAGATVVIEIHYSTFNTEAVTDRTRISLRFASGSSIRERKVLVMRNEQFTLPAGDNECGVQATLPVTTGRTLYSVTPHMHLLGTQFKIGIQPPGGGPEQCFGDFGWNFEHQNTYGLHTPIHLPAGSTVHITCTYDNSEMNPKQFNDPPEEVAAGRSSFNEMCQLVMGVVDDT